IRSARLHAAQQMSVLLSTCTDVTDLSLCQRVDRTRRLLPSVWSRSRPQPTPNARGQTMIKMTPGITGRQVTRKTAAALLGCLATASIATAKNNGPPPGGPDKREVITFDLVANPATIDCLRASYNEEPRARATVIRGRLNETLILDLDGIKPGLNF